MLSQTLPRDKENDSGRQIWSLGHSFTPKDHILLFLFSENSKKEIHADLLALGKIDSVEMHFYN